MARRQDILSRSTEMQLNFDYFMAMRNRSIFRYQVCPEYCFAQSAYDDIYVFKGASIAYQNNLKHAKPVTLTKCIELCHQDKRCTSFEYSKKVQSCDMSNVTHLTHELSLDNGDWNIYILNPAYKNIDCGSPKKTDGTSLSYSITNYRSKVTYTCNDGRRSFKSVCGKYNKWLPAFTSCKDIHNYFVKVQNAILFEPGKKMWVNKAVTEEACAKKCLSDVKCLSFEMTKKAYLHIHCGSPKYVEGALKSYTTTNYKSVVEYSCPGGEKFKARCEQGGKWTPVIATCKAYGEVFVFKRVHIPGQDNFEQFKNVDLKKCHEECLKRPQCFSYEYHERTKACDLSNANHLSHDLKPNEKGWDIYILNPGYALIDCGHPKEVFGAEMFYKSASYKSEVTYTCPEGETIKAVCGKDNKWTRVPPVCKAYEKVNCGPPMYVVGALQSSKTSTYKSKVYYTCLNEDKLISVCEKDSKWVPVAGCKADANMIALKAVGIPGQDNIGRHDSVDVKACNKACLEYTGCTSYEYNDKSQYCDLSNVTHATHELKPNTAGWDIYILNPAYVQVKCGPPKDVALGKKAYTTTRYKSEVTYTCDDGNQYKLTCEKDNKWSPITFSCKGKVDCKTPKDVAGAKKTYTTTTLKSEVIYTCPKGTKLKSICGEDNKWSSLAFSCKDIQLSFVKVKNASLDVLKKTLIDSKTLTGEACAAKCMTLKSCLSFEISKSGKCYKLEDTAAFSNHIKITPNRDYYQRVKPDDDDVNRFKATSVPKQSTIGRLKGVKLKECLHACQLYPGCLSFAYNEDFTLCNLNNASSGTQELKPNDKTWDTYFINPNFKPVKCGPPKDITGASKLFMSTTYKSVVTYTCSNGEKFKAQCEKDSKWSLVQLSCKDVRSHFIKIKEAILDVPEKTLWTKKKVAVDACAKQCWSDKNCLSFEIIKKSGYCYLSKKSAATVTKIKSDKSRDYYQRVKPTDEFITVKSVGAPKKDHFGWLRNVKSKECNEACYQHPLCNSYQYNEKLKHCGLSNGTQFTHVLKPSNEGWDTYIVNPVFELIDCGSPKDVFGASKSYKFTTYKSEVTYTCTSGEKLKSVCEKDNKWSWVEPICKGCNSYEYNEKTKFCDLSNATHMTHELETSFEHWDLYIINPVYGRINCKSPKDVVGASKSYDVTTYKSEVIYTCPNGKKFKSVCEKDSKWSSVASVCKDYENIDCRTPREIINASKSYRTTTYKSEVTYICPKGEKLKLICEKDSKWTPAAASCKVFSRVDCGSPKDVVNAKKSYTTTTYKSEVTYTCSGGQKLMSVCKEDNKWTPVASGCKAEGVLIFKKASIPGYDTFGQLKNVSLKECEHTCYQTPGCNSYEYQESSKICDLSNVTHLIRNLEPNAEDWDTYVINPVYGIVNCGSPKEIFGASKIYKSTTYKSEVTYVCPTGSELKSVCEKDSKWTPEVSSCIASDEQVIFKNAKLPEKAVFEKLQDKTLKRCLEACHQYPKCNSYEYNEKAKICELSNVTDMAEELKPIYGNWHVYIINPVYSKIDCGPPKDVAGAFMSYKTTTYKSKVSYTCPKEEKLKSVCEKDSKWAQVAPVCKGYASVNCGTPKEVANASMSYKTTIYKSEVIYACPNGEKLKSVFIEVHFVKVKESVLDVQKKTLLGKKGITADACAEKCLSDKSCLSFEITKERKCYLTKESAAIANKLKTDKSRDYYQKVKPTKKPLILKNVGIAKEDNIEQLKSVKLKECDQACRKTLTCTAYGYNEKNKLCDLSNVTQVSNELKPNDKGWDVYIIQPVYTKVDCGEPKNIVGASKSYKTSTYKSEVIYTCPGGKKFKSICKEDNKWSPVVSTCKAKDEFLTFKRTGIPGYDTFGRLKNVSLKECDHACHQIPGCNSYEYNEREMSCDPSNVTHLTHNLQPSKWGWDIYITNPVTLTIDCGPPKDVAGASKFYKNTAYKSEVTYSCRDGPSKKSVCGKNSKWTPVALICNGTMTIDCGPPKDVAGASKVYNTTAYKSEVTYSCPSGVNQKSVCGKNNKWTPVVPICKANEHPITFKRVTIPNRDNIGRLKNMNLAICKEACRAYPDCRVYEYNEKYKFCDLSNVTHLTEDLKPYDGNWDAYLINTVFTEINCGAPRDIAGASKFYNNTIYKSEVIYTCPGGEKQKSICEKNNLWTRVELICEVPEIKNEFVKITAAVLDVLGKTLFRKKNVTADACAEQCLSDENCLSFEITKEGGKCYLSKKSAAASKKIKSDKSRDYYQRVKRDYLL
ncbi:von Willebrand factor type A, EGF and pentraxin domain-containing 1-like [Octopus vulgaris]|uniref:von Willebrand factor type A, EGF and pentraxin domain-containing 1-like n=1 Tax=Octopus vulgaris TaxID=6645 RepID=A0AA36B7H4_OCTVU|nr:von Willebrand factor type A, EGF and pentraxin domain-containing 1-like [Octopus vulgaris]